MQFHHIGIACQNIPETLQFVKKSFPVTHTTDIIFDANQNADLCLLTLEDDSHIELVSGVAVEKFIKKRQSIYHTCWQVKNIDQAIEKLYDNGAMLISAPKEAILFDNRRVAFLFSDIGIIELLEETVSAF